MATKKEDHHLFNGSIHSSADVHTATKTSTTSLNSSAFLCSGCGKAIVDKYLLKALDVYWHEDCLKCGCCDCRLGEVGSTLYTRANLILCKRDYLRLFGTSGSCAACCKVIPAFEMVMRAKNNVYHLECFACQQCHQRFCVGDRFYLCDNKILCEYDYEERLIFANMSSNPASLAHIQRRVTDIQPGNSTVDQNSRFNHGFGQSLMEAPFPASVPATSLPPLPRDGSTAGGGGGGGSSSCSTATHPIVKTSPILKYGSPSDGSSSGYGSPDSTILEDR